MRRELLLAGAIGVLALTLGVGAVAVPGVLAEPSEDVRESYLDMRQPYVEASEIDGETVTLRLSNRLEHRGGTAENVTVETRAIDTETGLVTATDRQSLGDISGDRDVPFNTSVTVAREGGYRIETEVYADQRRQTGHRGTVSNLGALVPPDAQSPVGFHAFDSDTTPMEAIAYNIVRVEDDRATLNVTTYLTNTGNDPAGGVDLRLRARQADSNVVADTATVRVGEIRPGRTVTVNTELTVPDGYDYWLDGILSADGVIVATESSVADLDPTEQLSPDEERTETGFQSGDFAEEDEDEEREMDAEQTVSGGSGPGFTAVAALAALLGGGLIAARRHT